MKQVKLTKGYVSLVDDTDYAKVSPFKWQASVKYRADGTIRTIYAHRNWWKSGIHYHETMHGLLAGKGADHVDGNGLNNQSHNLRAATASNQSHNQPKRCTNTSGFKGVTFKKRAGKYVAQIAVKYVHHHLGYFDTAIEAGQAYNVAASLYHGQFAKLNNIPAIVMG